MAALEAMTVGLPVIAADNRGTREYMRQGVNGYICGWKDEKGFAVAIKQTVSGSAPSGNHGTGCQTDRRKIFTGTYHGDYGQDLP